MIPRAHVATLLLVTMAGCMGAKRPVTPPSLAFRLAGDYTFEPADRRTSGMWGTIRVDSAGTIQVAVKLYEGANPIPYQRACGANLQVVDDAISLACGSLLGMRLTVKDGELAPEADVWLERTVKKTRTSTDRQRCTLDGGMGDGYQCSTVVAGREVVERVDISKGKVSLGRE